MKTILLTLLLSSSCLALTLTPCQVYVIQHWPKYNFSSWAVAAGADDCYIKTATLAEVNVLAEKWVNEVEE